MILSKTVIIKEVKKKSKAKGFENFKVGDTLNISFEIDCWGSSYARTVCINGIDKYIPHAYAALNHYVLEEVK